MNIKDTNEQLNLVYGRAVHLKHEYEQRLLALTVEEADCTRQRKIAGFGPSPPGVAQLVLRAKIDVIDEILEGDDAEFDIITSEPL